MYCTRKNRYTDEYIENKRVNNQIYDSYYDAYIPVSDEKKRFDYISVENIRKSIREYKLADKSGGDNTYKQLDAFARSVMFFYPTMLTEKHKELMNYTKGIRDGSIKVLSREYEYRDINKELLYFRWYRCEFRCVIRCNFCFMNSVFKRL